MARLVVKAFRISFQEGQTLELSSNRSLSFSAMLGKICENEFIRGGAAALIDYSCISVYNGLANDSFIRQEGLAARCRVIMICSCFLPREGTYSTASITTKMPWMQICRCAKETRSPRPPIIHGTLRYCSPPRSLPRMCCIC